MLIVDISEYLPVKDDNFSCVTRVTGITGPSFITQDRRIYLPEFFGHAVGEAARSVADLSHIQDFMDTSNHDLIKWEDLTHEHMSQTYWGSFMTYMGRCARNKTKVKFAYGDLQASKKSVISLKKQIHFLISRVNPKAVQVQKHTLFWKILENQKLIGN